MDARKLTSVAVGVVMAAGATAQIPDLLTSFDSSSRWMGMGSGITNSGGDLLSAQVNPAALGFMDQAQLSLVVRNFPGSTTVKSRQLPDPDFETDGRFGSYGVAHVGYAFPVKRGLFGTQGSVGLTYHVGGYIDDLASGENLLVSGGTWNNYREKLRAKQNTFTLSYGGRLGNGQTAVGVALVVVDQYVANVQNYSFTPTGGSPVNVPELRRSSNGLGVGLQVGAQFIPQGAPNVVYGVSFRTPITLGGNNDTAAYYDKIPARLSAAAAVRRDGLRGGRDFLLVGGGLDFYFGGQSDRILGRKSQFVPGVGVEYNYSMSDIRIPIRVGYRFVPGAGDGFGNRNALTFGAGFRQAGAPYTFDLGIASPSIGGPLDISLGLTYRFDR